MVELLYYAALGRNRKVKKCLTDGVFVDAMNCSHETALFWAAKHNHTSTVKILLHHGADPNKLGLTHLLQIYKIKSI